MASKFAQIQHSIDGAAVEAASNLAVEPAHSSVDWNGLIVCLIWPALDCPIALQRAMHADPKKMGYRLKPLA